MVITPAFSVINFKHCIVPCYTGKVIYLKCIIKYENGELNFFFFRPDKTVSNQPFYALLGKKPLCNLSTSYTAHVILGQVEQVGPHRFR